MQPAGYKKGGSVTAEANRLAKYKAAMASRPNRQPKIAPDKANEIGKALKQVIEARSAAAPPMGVSGAGMPPQLAGALGAAAPPMMGAPAMRKGGKVMKKAEGGEIENENGPEAASRANAARMESYKKTVADTPASSDEGMSRGQAFRAARAAGKSTFMYNGTKYTTELASAKPSNTTVSGIDVVGKKPSTMVSEIEVVGTKPRTAALRNIRAAMMGTGYDPKTSAMKKGGPVMRKADGGLDSDLKQDKATVKAMIHKHERHDHPGKPLTKLRKGGTPC